MKKPRYTDTANYRQPYTPAERQHDGYLAAKWDQLYPGWRDGKIKEAEVSAIPQRTKRAA